MSVRIDGGKERDGRRTWSRHSAPAGLQRPRSQSAGKPRTPGTGRSRERPLSCCGHAGFCWTESGSDKHRSGRPGPDLKETPREEIERELMGTTSFVLQG
ncbi:hypothetical protein Q5P01_015523 [Channa striata]|uniref:Uncharacterized protein n=1 Tax=Channa striata TaxID=64152 RepID=A0AA88MDJ5_CHASR|nr:hypothetical protein Q5P01_015523 [Channa striata]